MEKYDLSKIILNNVFLLPNKEKIVKYFLDTDLEKILGDHELSKSDFEITTMALDNGSIRLIVDSIYASQIAIDICLSDGDAAIICSSNGEQLFRIIIGDTTVSNDSSFMDDVLPVDEHEEVSIENGDANSFRLKRSEEQQVVYDGTYIPVLAANGGISYFEFTSNSGKNSDNPFSLLERICESLKNNSLVEVEIQTKRHALSECVDVIYDSLRGKLSETRVKRDVKVRKRLPERKQI